VCRADFLGFPHISPLAFPSGCSFSLFKQQQTRNFFSFFWGDGGDKYMGFLAFCLQLNFVSVVKLFRFSVGKVKGTLLGLGLD